ncbi:dipeptidase [Agromyces sp. GXQ0307]|uniref:dipeptidase n=1 Tax=Agromyces sp. GXQ0307 TaxID=3377835 RepID=UPI00383A096A
MSQTRPDASSGALAADDTDHAQVVARLRAAVEAGFPSTVADLTDLVRIPSVSWAAFDPEQVARSADAVAELVRGLGVFDVVDVRRAPIGDGVELGHPAVVARREARNGRPTVLLYAHHDVQPPGRDEDWDSTPFEPTLRGDRLYGRGAADDKAGVMAHVAAIRALVDVLGTDLDLGIALFIEGEEEFGSRSFSAFLRENRELLEADAIVVADSNNWDVETPALTVALRGNVTFRLTVSTLAHASHSGMFGGAVPDAMLAAIRLLGTLHDDEGAVAVAGLSSAELETPPYDEAQLRAETGLLDGVAPIGRGPILSRIWAQPSITVTGIDAPTVANASNTLIPRVAVRVSARIAPGQDAAEALEALRAHLHANAPFGAHIEIDDIDTGQPFLVDTSGWAVADAKAAMAEAWGSEPVDIGVGGSIPFIAELVEEFPTAQILVTGVEDPDSRAHSPNESLHLGVFRRAVLAEAALLARLQARAGAERSRSEEG